jgi:DNA-binding transcriptional MerR regulator
VSKKFISLREVGRRLDIPPSTIVYYKDKFERFIPSEGGAGRRTRYPVEVLEIFRRIRKMFNDNWSTEQIEQELALKFGMLMNDQQSDQGFEQPISSSAMQDLAGVLSRMSDVLDNQSLFRSEIRSLRDEVAALRAEREAESARQEEAVRTLRDEVASLKRRLSAGGGAGSGIDFPPAEFLASPLVIASGGEFLGVQGKGKHFSLKDFVQLIERKESATVAVETSWKRQDGHWVLVVRTEDADGGREQNIVLVAKKTVTPSRNTVTEIIRLNIDGNDAPDALLLTLFRQLKTVFNG